MAIARYYRPDKQDYNSHGEPTRSFPGVPLADLDEAFWSSLAEWQQREIDASELYQKSRPGVGESAAHQASDRPGRRTEKE